jgi:hypothetical protein
MANDPQKAVREEQLDAAFERAKGGDFGGLDTIAEGLTDEDREIRLRAAWYCQQIGFPAAIGNLARMATGDEASENRNQAIYALAGVGRPAVVSTLISALNDEEPERREDARTALYYVLGKQVMPLLSDEFEEDPEEASGAADWWKEESGNFDKSQVYFMGEVAGPGSFIEELKVERPAVPDAFLASLNYWTGEDFGEEPFAEVVSKWDEWWDKNRQNYEAGRRYFYGRPVPAD